MTEGENGKLLLGLEVRQVSMDDSGYHSCHEDGGAGQGVLVINSFRSVYHDIKRAVE